MACSRCEVEKKAEEARPAALTAYASHPATSTVPRFRLVSIVRGRVPIALIGLDSLGQRAVRVAGQVGRTGLGLSSRYCCERYDGSCGCSCRAPPRHLAGLSAPP